ncbi:MAG TPA: sulfotransferase [Rhodanobacteraceae bacterium]|nr:sulfotransferase [Rhodanobacteraceae bacterium]
MTEAPALNDIVNVLQQGNTAVAEQLCRERLLRFPDDEGLLILSSLCLQRQERYAEAVRGYARLTELFPDRAAHWTNYATALRLAGRVDEAVEAASKAVALAPGEATYYVMLGQAQLQKGDYDGAQTSLLKACELDPASPEAHIHAANALAAVRDTQAYTLLRPWRSWLPLDAPEQLLLAHLLTTVGIADEAYEVLSDLMQRAPMHLPTRLQLIGLLERRNDLDAAESLLADTTARFAAMDAHSTNEIAHLRATLAKRRGNAEEARRILESVGPRNDLDCAHYFLLADIQDKLRDPAAAMESLAIAHARQRLELAPIEPIFFEPNTVVLPASKRFVTKEDHARWPELAAPETRHSPVFVVGFPRSGTTLLEQMLDAHPKLQSMDERPFFAILNGELEDLGVRVPEELHRLNQRDCDELRKRYLGLVAEKIRRRWDAQLVDKNPLNMLNLPLITRLFPNAKLILALRHPCDAVLSNYMQSYRSCSLAGACSTLERTARAYVAAMQAWLRDCEMFKPDVLMSRYEDLVEDPKRQAERYAEFLGIGDATEMLNYDKRAKEKGFIATPSYTEVVQPISARRKDRWRRYESAFEPVLPILKPMLDHWGYET